MENKKKVGKGREQTVEEHAETLEDRGDTAVSSFWTKGTQAIFDVRVTNLDSASQIKSDPDNCLRKHEKEKMLKYNKACLASRKSFTPLVFSCDGMKGPQAKAALKRLAKVLATKWDIPYSQVCNYVNSQLSIALVWATRTCLCMNRSKSGHPSPN